MNGSWIAIITNREADLVNVHPSSRGSVDLGGLTVERCPPVSAFDCTANGRIDFADVVWLFNNL